MCDVFIIGAESLLNFSEMQLNDKFLCWNQKKVVVNLWAKKKLRKHNVRNESLNLY